MPHLFKTLLVLGQLIAPAAVPESPETRSPLLSVQGNASSADFEPIAGVRELTGQLIVRPRQRLQLQAGGLDLVQAVGVRARVQQELRQHQVLTYVPQTDESVVQVPDGRTAQDYAQELLSTGLFEYAEPNWLLYPLSGPQSSQPLAPQVQRGGMALVPNCPNDPMLPSQWHHQSNRLGSCEGWAISTGSSSVSIGVCDTGIRTSHEDLQLNRLEGYNAVDRLWESQGGDISPAHYHGTRTTGTVAANGNNGIGISGMGWNLSHRMLRVSNLSSGGAQLLDLQHAVRTSIESGDRVANVSYHGAASASNATTATYVRSLGGMMVWGSGNTGTNYSHADRDADDLLVVGASDSADGLWASSSYGTFMDVVAPGVSILTTDRDSDSDYAVASGTSYAAPITAGVCAMIWSLRPTLSPNDVERILKNSAEDLGAPGLDISFGYGRVSLKRSLEHSGTDLPVADLAALPTSGTGPLTVQFRDLSTGVPTAWLWDFGDGNSSTEQNPSHIYTASGAHTVSLMASNSLGQDTASKTDLVLVDIIPPVAAFSASPPLGLSPLPVAFTDDSTGGLPTSWLWDFGDGSTSTQANPVHVYNGSGIYSVSLAVSNPYGMDQLIQTNLIAVDFIAPIAGFSATPTSGASPIVVDFSDESLGGTSTSWLWTFGDGSSSTQQSPSHTYTAAGLYSVRLKASNAYGLDELIKIDYINIGAGSSILANFTATPTTGTSPLQVTFTDLSVGNITMWEWDFGDGVTSTDQHPVHTYTSEGEYDVALQVTNAAGSDDQLEIQQLILVQ